MQRGASMITVATVSNRPYNLAACIHQVVSQDVNCEVEHLIVVDGLELSKEISSQIKAKGKNVSIIPAAAQPARYLFERLGALRNLAVRHASGGYLAFLDDDNQWETNHLSSLLQAATHSGLGVAHSWRTLWNKDNTPKIITDQYPWVLGGDTARQEILYRIQHDVGILASGTNQVRDRYGFEFRGSVFSCVDTGEWLFPLELLKQLPFRDAFSYTELLYGFCDDYLYGCELLKRDTKVATTREFTLRYFLGGNSQEAWHERARI